MSRFASLSAPGGTLNASLSELVAALIDKGVVEAVLVPARQPYGTAVMQTLIEDPGEAASADPLAPVVPASSAPLLAKLTRSGSGPRNT